MKMSKQAFESAIRSKMLEPQDIANIEVVPNEDCTHCELCNYLTPEPEEFNGRKLCEQCYLEEVENPKHRL